VKTAAGRTLSRYHHQRRATAATQHRGNGGPTQAHRGPETLIYQAPSDNSLTAGMDEVSEYVRQGVFRPLGGPMYALEDITDAHRSLRAGAVTGKRVVAIDTTETWT